MWFPDSGLLCSSIQSLVWYKLSFYFLIIVIFRLSFYLHGMFHLTPWTQKIFFDIFFFFFFFFLGGGVVVWGGDPCLLATLRENEWTDFHEIFSKGWTRDNLENFQDIAVNPLNPGSISLFYGFVIVGDIMIKKTGEPIFMKCQGRHKK